MAKRKNSSARRIPKARVIPRSRLSRVDVKRGEYNALVDILNERNTILNALREAIERLERASATQFTRIAQLQADVDELKKLRKGA
jgi:DNA-directed RNA polymerase subunit L